MSPKYRASYIDHLNNNSINKTLNPNNSNTNIETYNQMINRININSKNKIFFKKDCNIAKNPINNSSSILRGENDEDKNLLLNKIFCEKTDKFFSVDKSGIKNNIIKYIKLFIIYIFIWTYFFFSSLKLNACFSSIIKYIDLNFSFCSFCLSIIDS